MVLRKEGITSFISNILLGVLAWFVTYLIGGTSAECYIAASIWCAYGKLFDLIKRLANRGRHE
jgi:cytochrome c biogenesis protein CcdA